MSKPLIALSLCRWQLKDRDEGWYHLVGEKYVRAITNYGAFPFTVPALAGDLDIDTVLENVSGVIFGGSILPAQPARRDAGALAAAALSSTISDSEFQALHSVHWPCHLLNSAPHSLQT